MRVARAGPVPPARRQSALMSDRKTITVNLPHNLSQAEARDRIQNGFGRLRTQFAGRVGTVDDRWTGDHLDLSVTAMGQTVTGRADVEPQQVRVEIDLPWFLAMIADRVRGEVEREGRKMLEQK